MSTAHFIRKVSQCFFLGSLLVLHDRIERNIEEFDDSFLLLRAHST